MSNYNQSDLITQARVERMTELANERFVEIRRAQGIIDGCKVRIAELEANNRKRDLMLINHVRDWYRRNFREASDAHSSNILDSFNALQAHTPAAVSQDQQDIERR